MSARDWEKRVLAAKGAEERVAEIEQELLLASRLTALREGAGSASASSRSAWASPTHASPPSNARTT